ncbi:hypothetical protein QBC41DRAFT_154593 [Cercophora samala]|uniref:Secreted protein n=1 Tax=Cercophora samala TaxID=330535 RepID=A0AA39Z9V8_9PEZI|nr:hypothetical protein QBC41DRAFT_154593 [Cercophora samala]
MRSQRMHRFMHWDLSLCAIPIVSLWPCQRTLLSGPTHSRRGWGFPKSGINGPGTPGPVGDVMADLRPHSRGLPWEPRFCGTAGLRALLFVSVSIIGEAVCAKSDEGASHLHVASLIFPFALLPHACLSALCEGSVSVSLFPVPSVLLQAEIPTVSYTRFVARSGTRRLVTVPATAASVHALFI